MLSVLCALFNITISDFFNKLQHILLFVKIFFQADEHEGVWTRQPPRLSEVLKQLLINSVFMCYLFIIPLHYIYVKCNVRKSSNPLVLTSTASLGPKARRKLKKLASKFILLQVSYIIFFPVNCSYLANHTQPAKTITNNKRKLKKLAAVFDF